MSPVDSHDADECCTRICTLHTHAFGLVLIGSLKTFVFEEKVVIDKQHKAARCMARLLIAMLQLDYELSLPSASYLEKSKHDFTVDHCKDELLVTSFSPSNRQPSCLSHVVLHLRFSDEEALLTLFSLSIRR